MKANIELMVNRTILYFFSFYRDYGTPSGTVFRGDNDAKKFSKRFHRVSR
ncbi:hypothetical protein LEP1GSC168_0766 [Leptospira santarosai str. HAI134]|uniref:Uncharacterized protein n=1 Tax=Leptospira santarosai str. ZUN179 TaxID=1049985 RepID=M6UYP5_9LEPT|nr:hypothetical protein LEP1GSC071_3983 [Leptospira santarosai str. JET]EMO23557.1 hypothetical protein LEP1GSC168_0766 [Leptospira santarosai str. HAI134]EMO46119.1 hypothetical protein LEP1GSC187_0630 [Leptospira santarosai str. ZUN179]